MDNNQNQNGPGNPSDTRSPKRRSIKTFFKIVVTLVLFFAVATAIVVFLARSEPAYWQENQTFLRGSSPKQIEQLAEQVDVQLQALANLGFGGAQDQADVPTDIDGAAKAKLEDIHINTDQTITLTNDQIAAVVQTRVDQWMSDRGYVKPTEITDPMVAVDSGKLVMAFKLQLGGISQVISGKFDLTIRNDGMAELSMSSFLVGKLPVPAKAIGEHLRNQSGGDQRAVQVGQWLEKLQHMEFRPVIELEHRRRARVQDYKILKDSLELTVRIQDHKTYKAMNRALAGVTVD